ncbi:MAG: catalase/peroxidase HPI [Lachnospiraceae bacterium]|nr:catalase/peroxidase HPI [Lachnospiraceae bacterium]
MNGEPSSQTTRQTPNQTEIGGPDFTKGPTLRDWWPNLLNLDILHQNSCLSNPMGAGFNYVEEFKKLDLQALKDDIFTMMRDSQEWWPADYGHYGPFLIRMAWHSAGTYRTIDGRGGTRYAALRFPPSSSWPDNINLDKARRLLWPLKKKYGKKISWADLMILTSNCAMESMGFKPIGFAGGREDVWEPQKDVYWGSERTWLGDYKRYRNENDRHLEGPLAATQMGLIYVNPEGPDGHPDPLESAKDVRETFSRMAMDDEETVALVAGGHTFGKTHGAAPPATYIGPAPEAAPIEQQNLGWKNSFGTGNADDTIGSGLEGAWKPNPITWDMGYLRTLLKYDYELTKSPAGAYIWLAKDVAPEDMVIDAHDPNKWHRPMKATADLALKADPAYFKIAKYYYENPQKFKKAFANAWFKLTHRDMGPTSLYFGPEVPKETFLWQDPIPKRDGYMLNQRDIKELKCSLVNSGLTIAEMISTAWASASCFRGSDKRGGANGGRLRFEPQISWQVNQPERLRFVFNRYEQIQGNFINRTRRYVSFADLIVLGGAVGIEMAAKKAGIIVNVPFMPGRMDASVEQTDIEGMEVLEPIYDGFRNYLQHEFSALPEELLVDKAQQLTLTAPEMTVLLGGLRVLGNNYRNSPHGVFTHSFEALTNDFFINLLDMRTEWKATEHKNLFHGLDRKTGRLKWTATRVDLIFGSNAQLRAIAEVYASNDAKVKFVNDFISAWNKVMNADRFDMKR